MGIWGRGTPYRGGTKSEMLQVERALKRGWDIPEKARQAIPSEAIRMIAAKDESGHYTHSPRTRLAAMRVLTMMERQNIELELRDGDTGGITVNVGVGVTMGSEPVGEDRLAQVAAAWGVNVADCRAAIAGPDGGSRAIEDSSGTSGQSGDLSV